jgi:hypothetical protein
MPHRSAPLAAALALLSAPALAATAHNSQAGFYGPNTHVCSATPYFAAGGCLSDALVGGSTDQVLPRRAPPGGQIPLYRTRPPLRPLPAD